MRLAFDIETHPIADGTQLPRPVCLSYSTANGSGLVTADEGAVILEDALDSGHTIIAHNARFDLGAMALAYPRLAPKVATAYERGAVHCTKVWTQLQDYAVGVNTKVYNLGAVARRFKTSAQPDKGFDGRTRYGELDGTPIAQWPQEYRDYALADAIAADEIAAKLRDVPDVAAQSRWDYALGLCAAYGLRTDPDRVALWGAQLESRRRELAPRLKDLGLIRWQAPKRSPLDGRWVRDMKEIRTRVAAAYNGNPPLTAGGKSGNRQPRTDAETCKDSGDPTLDLYAEYAGIGHALSNEWPQYQGAFVHTNYGLAETGRSTSSGPPLQNLSKTSGARYCFQPRDGNVFCIIDYSGLELSTLAQLCVVLGTGDGMAKAIREGRSLHDEMAAMILGCDVASLRLRDGWEYARQCAKGANFGFPGGLGPASFVAYAKALYGLRLTVPEATRLRHLWRMQTPEVVRYQRRIADLLEAHCSLCGALTSSDAERCSCGGTIRTGTLDHYRSGRLRGGLSYTKACNTLFQGLGGDVTKAALWALLRAGWPVAVFVHDEYVIEVPRQGAAEAARECQRILESVAADWLPDAPPRAEPVLATRWAKGYPRGWDRGLAVYDPDNYPG